MFCDPKYKDVKDYPVGRAFIVKERFKKRCCDFYFEVDDIIFVERYTSKKILGVTDESSNTGYHHIKKGMITNYCEEIAAYE
jgi:hypothetical protein